MAKQKTLKIEILSVIQNGDLLIFSDNTCGHYLDSAQGNKDVIIYTGNNYSGWNSFDDHYQDIKVILRCVKNGICNHSAVPHGYNKEDVVWEKVTKTHTHAELEEKLGYRFNLVEEE